MVGGPEISATPQAAASAASSGMARTVASARPREAVRSEKWQGRHMNTPIDIYGYLWIFNYI